MIKSLARLDFWLIAPILVISVISLTMLYDLSFADQPPSAYFLKQLVWFLIGFGLFFLAVLSFDFRILQESRLLLGLYALALLMLVAVLFFGHGPARAWFNFIKFNIQPLEVAKIILILLLAKIFSHRLSSSWSKILISGFYTFLFAFLIALEPDLGSAIVLVAVWFLMILFSGVRLKQFGLLILGGALIVVLTWTLFLKPYQKQRVISFLNPNKDPLGSGYNVLQAKIAIGSGGFWGKGIGGGEQARLKFLPEAKTDFILAAFMEEWGLLGFLFLLLMVFIICLRLFKIILETDNLFSKMFVLAFLGYFLIQIFINASANLGILPVTGLPFPLLSYGGSNLVTFLVALGFCQNIRINTRERH